MIFLHFAQLILAVFVSNYSLSSALKLVLRAGQLTIRKMFRSRIILNSEINKSNLINLSSLFNRFRYLQQLLKKYQRYLDGSIYDVIVSQQDLILDLSHGNNTCWWIGFSARVCVGGG